MLTSIVTCIYCIITVHRSLPALPSWQKCTKFLYRVIVLTIGEILHHNNSHTALVRIAQLLHSDVNPQWSGPSVNHSFKEELREAGQVGQQET